MLACGPLNLTQNQRDVCANLETTITNSATTSAMAEVGEQGFNRLAEIAAGDAEFAGMLRQ